MSASNSYNLDIIEQGPKVIEALESFFDGFKNGLDATVEVATETGVAKTQADSVKVQEGGIGVLATAGELRDALTEYLNTYKQLQDL